MVSCLKKNVVFCFSNPDKTWATARHEFPGVIQSKVVSGLNYTVLIIILVCVDEGLQETCDGALSVSDIFAHSFKEDLVNC